MMIKQVKLKHVAALTLFSALAACNGRPDNEFQAPRQAAQLTIQSSSVNQTAVSVPYFRNDYTITKSKAEITLNSNIGGPNQIVPITTHVINFLDATTSFDTSDTVAQVYRLYQAAFNRKPDPAGLGYWIAQKEGGMDMPAIASAFISSSEFQARYGTNPSAAVFVDGLYRNVLHRPGDPDGIAWWANTLNTGATTWTSALLGFSESDENKAAVVNDQTAGFDYIPYLNSPEQADCTGDAVGDKTMMFGIYGVANSMWGKANMPPGVPLVQCAGGRLLTPLTFSGYWTWNLPKIPVPFNPDPSVMNGAPKSFPSLMAGSAPDLGITKVPSRKIADIRTLGAEVDLDYVSNDYDSTFFDITFSTTPTDTYKNMSCDFAITIRNTPFTYTWLTKVESGVLLNGHRYDVYYSHPRSDNPNYYSVFFNIQDVPISNSHLRVSMKLKPFVDYAVQHGFVGGTDYYSGMMFGTEVVSGTGQVRVNKFALVD